MDPRIPASVILLISSILSVSSSALFSPADNHLLDCGSSSAATTLPDRRVFLPDSDPKLFSTNAHTLTAFANPPTNPNPLYRTARIFASSSSYRLPIRKIGPHLLRLHFHPFSTPNLNLSSAHFHVFAGDLVLLSDFHPSPLLKEFIIPITTKELVLSFVPAEPSSFAFINAIELLSAPAGLVPDSAHLVGPNPDKTLVSISRQAMETVHRINVGGPTITPFNDTLWRTWLPDAAFVLSAGSKTVAFSGRIRYRDGGASREVGPDNMYNSARTSTSNMTWNFPVDPGYKYLLRLHFCDIASLALNELYLDVFVNGYAAYQDLDLSSAADQVLASPYYVDFVADVGGDSVSVVVGPSNTSDPRVGAVLNGLEIMKINNTAGSLDGELPEVLVLEMSNAVGPGRGRAMFRSLVCGVVFVALVGMGFMLLTWWKAETKNSVAWSPLPIDSPYGILMKGKPGTPDTEQFGKHSGGLILEVQFQGKTLPYPYPYKEVDAVNG